MFGTMSVAENLEMGGFIDRRACQEAHGRALRALPHAGREAPCGGPHLERRPAPDPGHGDRADERARPAAARRADGGPQPACGGGAVRHHPCPEQDGRGHPDGRAERAGGAGGVGPRLRAGAGPAEREGGRRPGGTIRRCAISFSAARLRLCSAANRGDFNNGTGDSHDHPHRPPRRAALGVSPPLAAPGGAARAGRSDQARHADAAHRRGRPLRPGDGQGAAAVVEEVNKAGGVLGRQRRAGERGRPDQSRGRRARRAQADRRRQGLGDHGHLGLVGDDRGGAALLGEQDLPCTVSGADSITLLPHQGYLIRTQPNSKLQVRASASSSCRWGPRRPSP